MGRRPSGTSATVTPIANRNPSRAPIPISVANRKKAPPTTTAIVAIVRTTRSSSCESGLLGRGFDRASWAIEARRVRGPVAITSAVASPSTRKVPAKAGSPRSRELGTLSPVSVEVSTEAASERSTRRSAGTRSPASSTIRSPTTTDSASITTATPSRITRARTGSSPRSEAAARSARCSCAKANAPFSTTTRKIAIPSWGIPAAKARPPAAQSNRAKKWTNCRASTTAARGGACSGNRLGPSRRRRAAASAAVRPEVVDVGASVPIAPTLVHLGSTRPRAVGPPRPGPEASPLDSPLVPAQASCATAIGSVVGASGHDADSTVTAIVSADPGSASRSSATDPSGAGIRQPPLVGASPSIIQTS